MNDSLPKLENWFRQFPSVIVAYSGGVDSALLMAAAHKALGEKALACIGTSPSYPERELASALEVAGALGAKVRVVRTEEHLDPNYAANPANRCYFCKSELFGKLKEIAEAEKIAVIVDGNNASDLGEDRPGWLAGRERGVRSPLAELAISTTIDSLLLAAAGRALPMALSLPETLCIQARSCCFWAIC